MSFLRVKETSLNITAVFYQLITFDYISQWDFQFVPLM